MLVTSNVGEGNVAEYDLMNSFLIWKLVNLLGWICEKIDDVWWKVFSFDSTGVWMKSFGMLFKF